MQTVTKIALASLTLLGAVAAVAPAADAQGYGYGYPYTPPPGYGSGYPYEQPGYACGRDLSQIVNFIIDPAIGRPVTQAQYKARYPWTDTTTWTYDCASNLWTDHTQEYYYQSQDYRGRWDRDRRYDWDQYRYRDRDHDGDRR